MWIFGPRCKYGPAFGSIILNQTTIGIGKISINAFITYKTKPDFQLMNITVKQVYITGPVILLSGFDIPVLIK